MLRETGKRAVYNEKKEAIMRDHIEVRGARVHNLKISA